MTRRVFNFDQPDRFIAGAVGQPGQRVFFLQASKGDRIVSVALEKVQVAALAQRVAMLLLALRQGGMNIGEEPSASPPTLDEPVVEEFRVGTLAISWDGERERVIIEAREIGDDEGEADEADQTGETDESAAGAEALMAADPAGSEQDVVRVHLEPRAALEFASGAIAVVQAGRPACPQCGEPLDPGGHFCVRRNGHLN